MKSPVKLTFLPANSALTAPVGSDLKDIIRRSDIPIDFACGGEGQCGKCKIQIKKGIIRPNAVEKKLLSPAELKNNFRLACQTRINHDMVIATSEEISAARKNNIGFTRPSLTSFNPVVKKSRSYYGLALDIGTTTVAGSLVDLITGAEIAAAAETNPQAVYGADVISRVNHAVTHKNGLGELQKKIIGVINKIISQLTKKASIKTDPLRQSVSVASDIRDITIVGNTVMQHLLLGRPVDTLAVLPFEPAYRGAVNIKAIKLKINVHPEAGVSVFPHIAGFVGGDAVGLILALDLHRSSKINLAIDIGTNGEIVLGNRDGLICASAAAGPAFEGVRINCGMRAASGAIESVHFTKSGIRFKTIDNAPPLGICGSGLIDVLAELLKYKIIDETGRLVSRKELLSGAKLPVYLRNSIIEANQTNAFRLFRSKKTVLEITQSDIRELQLAKGAIAAGIALLKKETGVADKDIERVFIAGTFGNYINKENACRIGLMAGIPSDRIVFVGNAALTGAKLALISREVRTEAEKIARTAGCLNLSRHKMFQDEFAEAMYFTPKHEIAKYEITKNETPKHKILK